jgi:hypothetical protein
VLKTEKQAKERAEHLMTDFAFRSSDEQLTPEIKAYRKENKKKHNRIRKRAALSPDEEMDAPFLAIEILKGIKRLKSASAPGEDGLSNEILANASPELIHRLLGIFNASWALQKLVPAWKIVVIIPIPKPHDPSCSRPISLLSCIYI